MCPVELVPEKVLGSGNPFSKTEASAVHSQNEKGKHHLLLHHFFTRLVFCEAKVRQSLRERDGRKHRSQHFSLDINEIFHYTAHEQAERSECRSEAERKSEVLEFMGSVSNGRRSDS